MADKRRKARSELVLVSLIAAVLAAGPGAHSAARVISTGPSEAVVRIVVGSRPLGQINPHVFGSNLLWPYNAEGAFDPATRHFLPGFCQRSARPWSYGASVPRRDYCRQFRLVARDRAAAPAQ